MQKTMSKRLVSMVLTICMVIGLMPTQFMQFKAAAADVYAPTYKYDLYKMQYNGNRGYPINELISYNPMTVGHEEEINPAIISQPYKFEAMSVTKSFEFASTAYGFMMVGAPNDWVSLRIKVPEAGVYKPSVSTGKWTLGPQMSFFMAPVTASSSMDAQYKIGDLDTYNSTAIWKSPSSFDNIDLEAGEYIFSFKITGKNAANTSGYQFAIDAIGLDLVTPRELKLAVDASAPYAVANGRAMEFPISATLNGGAVNMADASSVTAVSRDTSIATVTVANNKISITGKKYADTFMDVTVVHSGKTAKLAVPIRVGKQSGYTYDYMKMRTSGSKGVTFDSLTDYKYMTSGDPGEINTTNGVFSNAFMYPALGDTGKIAFVDSTYGCMFDGAVGQWASVQVRVDEPGEYQAISRNGFWTSGAKVKLYLAPKSVGVNDASLYRDAQYCLGEIDSYASSNGNWVSPTPLKTVSLQGESDYILTYEMVGKNPSSGGMRFPVGAFILLANKINHLSIGSVEKISNQMGDTVTKPIYTKFNGTKVDAATLNSLTASVSDPSIASARIVTNGAGKDLIIESKIDGKTNITLTGSLNGVTTTTTIPVEVSRPSYKYNYHKLRLSKNTGVDIKTLTSFDMTRAFNASEINKNLGGAESDPYMFASMSDTTTFGYADGAYGAMMNAKNVGDHVAFKLEVLSNAKYKPVSVNGLWNTGGIVDVFLAPENATDPRAAEYLLGTIDSYYGGTAKWTERIQLKTVELNKGSYVLSYVLKGQNPASSGKLFAVGSFELALAPKDELLINASNTTVYQGNNSIIPLKATLDGAPVAVSAFQKFNVTSANTEILTIDKADDNGVAVNGVKAGTTTIEINAEYNGIAITKSIPVEVRTAQFVYDYMKVAYRQYGTGVDIHTVTDFAMTTMGDPKEINLNAPFCAWTDPWIFNAETSGGKIYYTDTTYGCMMEGPIGSLASMKIRVPVTSVYSAISRNGFWANAGIVNIYLAPENAANPHDIKYLLKQVDCYKSSPDWVVKVPLRNVTLEAGVYTLTYEIVGKNPSAGASKFPVGAFILETPKTSEVYLTNDTVSRVMTGGNSQVALHLDIDGASKDFSSVTDLNVTSADTKIATAKIIRSDADKNAAVEITGVAEGTTTLTVLATVNGKVATANIPISIVNPLALDRVEVTADKTTLKAGENAQLSMNAYRMNGSTIDMSQMVPYYQSSDARVVSVDASGKLTARDRGTATITAFVEINGIMCKATQTITVDTSATILDAKITAPGSIEIGENYNLKISGKLSGGMNYSSETAATFAVESMSPANCVTLTGNTLTGNAVGTVTIKATVPQGDNQLKIDVAPITIEIHEATGPAISKVVYDFRADQGTKITDATVAKNGWALNKTLTDPKVYGDNAKELRYQIYGIAALASQYNTQTGSDVTFDVNIPTSGVYALAVDGGNYAAGFLASIYIDGKYVGKYDFYNPGAVKIGPAVTMNTVEMTRGTHTVTFRRTSEKLGYLYLGSMTFNKVDKMPTYSGFALSAEQEKLSVGESCKLTAGPQMSDGSPCNVGNLYVGNAADTNNYYNLENLTPDIVAIENGRIRALKAGQATLKVSGKYNGQAEEKTLAITVDDEKISTIEPSVEKSNLTAGETVKINTVAKTASGRVLNPGSLQITATPETNGIVSVAGGVITAVGNGTTKIQVSATLNGTTVTGFIEVIVTGGAVSKLVLSAPNTSMKPNDADGEQITVKAIDVSGADIDLKDAVITYESLDKNIIYVTETGVVMPVAVGKADILVTAKIGEMVLTGKINFNITLGKTSASFYTPERVEALRENNKKYDWARQGSDALIKKAEKFLDKQDVLWNMVTTQELPRGITVGYRHDPNAYLCRYCGTDLRAEYGSYGWLMDPFTDEFKLQCPECRRKFPSNDFKSFYQTGIQEDGTWSYEKAKAEGQQYLKNVLYPEMDEKLGVENWGVDDGYGYRTGKIIVGGNNATQEETHTYIAYYNHWGLWYEYGNNKNGGIIQQALETLREAYLYTGDARYGRIGATLVDRIADVYPEMYIKPFFPRFFNSDSTQPLGKQVGCIWQHGVTRTFVKSYDAFYPMYDDPQVMRFISNKAQQINAADKKQSATMVRQRIEDNILRQSYKDIRSGNIHGNFGMHQSCAAYVGVVLDSMPETKEIIDWVFKSSSDAFGAPDIRGGNVLAQMINLVDRDGHGSESAPGYNWIWTSNMINIADVLAGYKTYSAADLYKNSKFLKMFKSMFPLTLSRRTTAQIGDYGATGKNAFVMNATSLLKGYYYSKDPEIAQFIYMMNGNKVDGLHGDTMMANPESIQQDILDVIKKYGEYDMDRSQQLAGYGFSILRDGSYFPSAVQNQIVDTQRDFWFYYGGAKSHKHMDVLNLGIEAYGFNMAPDFGYPEAADGAEKNVYWGQATIIHNTVMVNNEVHNRNAVAGNPLHFDDSGRVKVMDVDAPKATLNGVAADPNGILRRTIVMVRVNDEISYGVDFYRVKGGNEHLYNFHAMSDEIYEVEGLNFIEQKMGSYAGPEVKYATSGYKNGFSWLKNVRRAAYPGSGEFAVDFKIKDFRKLLPKPMDLHLRMTMLNDFDLSEVALASGQPPQAYDNPEWIEFVLARRTGSNLDSLFTTVFEPYNGERYIKSMTQVPIYRNGGAQPGVKDTAKAIKVEQVNGNIDYIVYATNNLVQYRVDNKFDFSGFIGVYTEKNGQVVYTYGNDATRIGDAEGIAAYTGKIVDFTHDLIRENSITVTFDQTIDPAILKNKFINISNGSTQNAAYQILNVTTKDNKNYVLDIGDVTLINATKNADDLSAGYIYNIAEGQNFSIPLPLVTESAPIFRPIEDMRAEVGSELKFQVVADSISGRDLTYSANTLPRGANFDAKTQTFSWIPDAGQRGENHASIDVTDGTFTETLHVKIKVYDDSSNGIPTPPPSSGGGTTGGGTTGGGTTGGGATGGGTTGGGTTIKTEFNVEGKLDSSKNAVATPSATDITKGLNSDADKVTITVKETKNATGYAVKLPTSVLTNNSMNKNVVIDTPAGSAVLPTDMLANDASVVSSKNATISVAIAKNESGFNVSLKLNGKDYAWENADASVKVSTSFTPSQDMKNTNCIIVKDAKGNIIPNGKFAEGSVSVYTPTLGVFTIAYNEKAFGDLGGHKWANDAVTRLAAREIINGTSATTYAPGANITRADFTVLTVRTFGFAAEGGEEFSDVDKNAYYADAVAVAQKLGIVGGSAGKFNPKAQISREDMMVIIARALDKAGYTLSSDEKTNFSDTNQVSSYASDAVNKLTASGVVAGSNGKINPKGKTTRAEVAVLLDRLVFAN